MYRNIIDTLAAWYESDKQVLLLKGAKGVGKTWTIIDFAAAFFENYLVVDFEKESDFLNLFLKSVDAERLEGRIRSRLKNTVDREIVFDDKQLLIFDEAQLLKKPLPGIMAYAMQRPDVRICIVTSWVGSLEGEDFYDDLEIVHMYPMTFEEFLTANKAQHLCKYIEKQKLEVIAADVKKEIKRYLKLFMMTGGMPEVVQDYVKYQSFVHTDAILTRQLSEIRSFIRVMVPHALERKVLQIWDSIPVQLTKENRKFMYGYVDEKARSREYEGAVNWLVNTGFVRRVNRVAEGVAPLADSVDMKSFELYHLDHGLLRDMCNKPLEIMENEDEIFEMLDGLLTEQYVVSELNMNANVKALYFWISGATAKVDFVFEDDGEVIPVDVQSKVENRVQSIRVFQKKYNNRMSIRISLEDLSFGKGILNIPLYGLWNF